MEKLGNSRKKVSWNQGWHVYEGMQCLVGVVVGGRRKSVLEPLLLPFAPLLHFVRQLLSGRRVSGVISSTVAGQQGFLDGTPRWHKPFAPSAVCPVCSPL